ncbi:hypothetical protein JFU37_04420 [Pseudomonas sp. TH41]|uniref:hypothetical protein n=1 Tax=Pseudomonas sp. TH41 TaxID=2796405 RepID=UPI0019128462|nr:hypothetical protein [Pseudomonas sp. TH41]MBK5351758.1 hypothetical protein [Pseudomonas sp. TH41]
MKAKYIKNIFLTTLLFSVSFLVFSTETKETSILEKQKEALLAIQSFAASICDSVKAVGKQTAWEASTDAKAKLGGVVKVISDLGVEGAAKYKSSEYEGVLQSDLSKVLTDQGSCRHSVFIELKDKLIPESGTSIPPGSSKASTVIYGEFGKTVQEVEQTNKVTTSLHKDDDTGTFWISYKQPIFGKSFIVAQNLDNAKKTEMARASYKLLGGDSWGSKGADIDETHTMCSTTHYNSMLSQLIQKFGTPTDIKNPKEKTTYSNDGGVKVNALFNSAGAAWRFSDESKLLFQMNSRDVERTFSKTENYWECIVELCAIPTDTKETCFDIPGLAL